MTQSNRSGKNHKRRTLSITLLFLILLLLPSVWITDREWKQARLDHALIEAIKAGDDKRALEALAAGASGEARDTEEPPTFRETLLHLWRQFQHSETIDDKRLPALLVLYRKATGVGSPPGGWIDNRGPNLEVVRALLEHGARVNDCDSQSRTPLMYASTLINRDAVRLLLAHGAKVEANDTYGLTALMVSNEQTAPILLEHGANLEARTKIQQYTPLIIAAIRSEVRLVYILLDHGANVSATDRGGKTALNHVTKFTNTRFLQIRALLRKYDAR